MLGIALDSAALVFALIVWVPLLTSHDQRHAEPAPHNEGTIQIEFTPEEIKKLEETKEIGDLFETAGGFIKQKLEERNRAESASGGAP